jgi:type IV pilus assembly protein PilC
MPPHLGDPNEFLRMIGRSPLDDVPVDKQNARPGALAPSASPFPDRPPESPLPHACLHVYRARRQRRALKTATIDAPSREDVVAQLRRQRLSVVKVDEEAKPKKPRGSIKMRDIVIFTRQFSTMINAGLPLVQALDILAKQTENKVLPTSPAAVVFDVESGHTVADALRKHPQGLQRPVRQHGRGRRGGRYPRYHPDAPGDVHGEERRPGAQGEGRDDLPRRHHGRGGLRDRRAAHLRHPVFQEMFTSVGMPLPLPTRIVIGMSQFLKAIWWLHRRASGRWPSG